MVEVQQARSLRILHEYIPLFPSWLWGLFVVPSFFFSFLLPQDATFDAQPLPSLCVSLLRPLSDTGHPLRPYGIELLVVCGLFLFDDIAPQLAHQNISAVSESCIRDKRTDHWLQSKPARAPGGNWIRQCALHGGSAVAYATLRRQPTQ